MLGRLTSVARKDFGQEFRLEIFKCETYQVALARCECFDVRQSEFSSDTLVSVSGLL